MDISFAVNHRVGCCLKPKNLSQLPLLMASGKFMVPRQIDCRDYAPPTDDQGDRPWCAAYAVANWAESMLWRKNDSFDQINPEWIYAYAKKRDGMPEVDGTTITDALEALRGSVFDRDLCKVKVIRPNRQSFQYAVHKFGVVAAGFDISDAWYRCDADNPVIDAPNEAHLGGHAVLIAGYDRNHVYIQNSWGASDWGEYGFAKLTWATFDAQIVYGAVLSNVLDGLTINT